METIKKQLDKLDNFQQKHKTSAFPIAVLKRYVDGDGGRLAALITYYGFLSLFPLILAATTVANLFFINTDWFQTQISETIDQYFPVLGEYLRSNIHGFDKSGLALLLGLLVVLYGARGGASAIRHSLNQIWEVPRKSRLGFPASTTNSFLIIVIGGGGLLLAAAISSYATVLGNSFMAKLPVFAISFSILVLALYQIYSLGINSRQPRRRDLLFSAVVAAVGVQILQILGGYLLTHQLKNLSNLYGAFAAVLALMFWIFLQAQVLIFAGYAGYVHAKRFWPRKFID